MLIYPEVFVVRVRALCHSIHQNKFQRHQIFKQTNWEKAQMILSFSFSANDKFFYAYHETKKP